MTFRKRVATSQAQHKDVYPIDVQVLTPESAQTVGSRMVPTGAQCARMNAQGDRTEATQNSGW